MSKPDFSRDYYADLELPSSADVNDIKKQFRKLALKYHPDRNPGKEVEVNARFQTIQAAHELLTNAEQKAKYDNYRGRNASRYPTASGVRGNPWQDVAAQYPMPPRRPPGQAPTSATRKTPSSGGGSSSGANFAKRYSGFNAPPSAKTTKEDLNSRYAAFTNMRQPASKSTAGQSASAAYSNAGTGANTGKKANTAGAGTSAAGSSSTSMPPPPPRTASQRQKAEASFGAKRSSGFYPQSPVGDEPPAAGTNNYATNRTHNRPYFFGEQPDQPFSVPEPPAADQRRASTDGSAPARDGEDHSWLEESLLDGRLRTPYQTHGGEKLNPFDGIPVPTSSSTSGPQGRPEFRRRSSSLPDESDNATKAAAAAQAPPSGANANTGAPRTGTRRTGASSRANHAGTSSTMPQFDEQYRKMQEKQNSTSPNVQSTQNAKPAFRNDASAANAQNAGSSQPNDKSRPILYGTPTPLKAYSTSTTRVRDAPGGGEGGGSGDSGAREHAAAAGASATSSYCKIYAPESRRRSPKRRAYVSNHESSSGDAKDRRHKTRPDMNAFETKQYDILQGLVRDIKVFDPTEDSKSGSKSGSKTGHKPPSRAASSNRADVETEKGNKLRRCRPAHSVSGTHGTNKALIFSSNLSLDDDVFSTPGTPDGEKTNPFTRSSVEDVNTRFVSAEKTGAAWEFSAGGSEGDSGGDIPARVRRSQSGSRIGRRSPAKGGSIPRRDSNPPIRPPMPPPRPPSSTASIADGSFGDISDRWPDGSSWGGVGGGKANNTTNYSDAKRWAEQVGSDHVAPQQQPQQQQDKKQVPPVPARQPTPNQQQPRPIKKPKPIQKPKTTGRTFTIDLTNDDSESEATPGQQRGERLASPVAMDIDSPSPQPVPTYDMSSNAASSGATNASEAGASVQTGAAKAQANGARNIPVEPTRPEWRAGNAEAATGAAAAAAAAAVVDGAAAATSKAGVNDVGGSEDSEEFRASLADIRNMEPFAEPTSGIHGHAGAGLGSFGDLRSHLPFESKAAPVGVPPAPRPAGRRKTISFPKPPTAPHPPPTLAVPGLQPTAAAWDRYVSDFRHYMLAWTAFNNLCVDHFQARRNEVEVQRRRHGDFSWLTDVDNEGINHYLDWMDQDQEVRARWSAACDGHDLNVRQFMAFRERMRQT